MRALVAVFLTSLTVAALPAAGQQLPASAYGEAVFVVSGRGWGHGVGMSQYGAYGQARIGRTYDQILGHYYSDTTIGKAGRKEVRVLLAEGRQAVTVSSTAPFLATDAAGTTFELAKGAVTLRSDLALPSADGTGPKRAKSPLVLRPGTKKAVLALDGKAYRGKIELVPQGGYLRVVNVSPLESYLQGVVAGEVPYTWPAEVLKAQAVAARSYALANLVKGKPYDLYSDVRSQVYLGVAGEKPSTTQAVTDTAGEVVLYAGKVATTYYFSTSGGRTASAADVFGFDVPYLQSRPDPWDKASPHHRWGPTLLGARTVQAKLGAEARVFDATGMPTPSGRLRSLVLQTTSGPQTVPATLVRTALGLRSTWITFGVIRLDRPASGTVTFGSTARLTGVARLLGTPRIGSSADGSTWTDGTEVTFDKNGVVTADVKPTRATRYRLQAEGAASTALLIQVAPKVQLLRPTLAEPTTIRGTVRPRVAGAMVTVERRKGTGWVVVGDATVDATGAFSVPLDVAAPAGAYRARVAETAGYTAAISPVLQVPR
ncbi:MAG TPA: SpoIID/LytB domain-containing protein [Gaiellaceae bacterium]|nr:SpoIID/LytB domain-containing protein [Gaiellaceae bacterium]